MTILTIPFILPVYRDATAVGMLMTIALAVGTGFGLTSPKVSIGAFGVAALIGWLTGHTTPFTDLTVSAFVAAALAVLALIASRAQGATSQPALTPATSNAASAPLVVVAPLVPALEQLGWLHAAAAPTDEEFLTLKGQLMSRAAN